MRSKSGSHSILIVGHDADDLQVGDIGLCLDEAKTLVTAIQEQFVSARVAEIVETRRRCGCGPQLFGAIINPSTTKPVSNQYVMIGQC